MLSLEFSALVIKNKLETNPELRIKRRTREIPTANNASLVNRTGEYVNVTVKAI